MHEPQSGGVHHQAPHALPAHVVATRLDVDPSRGLAPIEVDRRAAIHGPNAVESERRATLPKMLLDAATEPFVLLLFAAGVGAILLGEIRDGILVLTQDLANVPFSQEGMAVVIAFSPESSLPTLPPSALTGS